MKHEPSIFDDPEAEAESLRRARADVREGRTISNAAMTRWLKSWGTSNRLPKPNPGD
jgi:hypothetical protein